MSGIAVVQGMGRADGAPSVNARARVVWTTDEKKHLDRAARDFNMHGDKLLLLCGSAVCPDPRMTLQQDVSAPGGMILRCGCTDRVFSPTC